MPRPMLRGVFYPTLILCRWLYQPHVVEAVFAGDLFLGRGMVLELTEALQEAEVFGLLTVGLYQEGGWSRVEGAVMCHDRVDVVVIISA
jgi:hypothetical protein